MEFLFAARYEEIFFYDEIFPHSAMFLLKTFFSSPNLVIKHTMAQKLHIVQFRKFFVKVDISRLYIVSLGTYSSAIIV